MVANHDCLLNSVRHLIGASAHRTQPHPCFRTPKRHVTSDLLSLYVVDDVMSRCRISVNGRTCCVRAFTRVGIFHCDFKCRVMFSSRLKFSCISVTSRCCCLLLERLRFRSMRGDFCLTDFDVSKWPFNHQPLRCLLKARVPFRRSLLWFSNCCLRVTSSLPVSRHCVLYGRHVTHCWG